MKIVLTWSTTLIMKKVNSVDNATNRKIISLFLKHPADVMILLNAASAQVPVIKMEARYEVKILSKVKGYSMRT